MEPIISKSTNPNDYEILIRKRGDNQYAAYCPQINFMIVGEAHVQVQNLMIEHVDKHIATVKTESNN